MQDMKCTYCLTKQYHMLVIRNADGSWHVHAPFQDREVMKIMIRQVEKAMEDNCKTEEEENSDFIKKIFKE